MNEIHPHLKIYIVFISSSLFLTEAEFKNKTAAAAVTNDDESDGKAFLKAIVDGKKLSRTPDYLVFTAPYRLCEGGCSSTDRNLVLEFPMYVGNKAKEVYQKSYDKDWEKVHSKAINAPFERTTVTERTIPDDIFKKILIFSPSKTTATTITTTTTTTTTTTPTTTTIKRILKICPKYGNGICVSQANNTTVLRTQDYNTTDKYSASETQLGTLIDTTTSTVDAHNSNNSNENEKELRKEISILRQIIKLVDLAPDYK